RRAARRAHDRRRGHGAHPGLYGRQDRRAHRAGFHQNPPPAPDALRDDARKRAGGLWAGPPHLSGIAHNNRTLWIAFAANMGIAVSKFVAAPITGSSAMLPAGVHPVVETSN